MTSKETWNKTGNDSIVQRITDNEKTLTRVFNFAQKTLTTALNRNIGTATRYTEEFKDSDDGLLREAWAEMQRQGVPDGLDYRPEPTTKQRKHLAAAVANVFKHGLTRDIAAPEQASFKKKKLAAAVTAANAGG